MDPLFLFAAITVMLIVIISDYVKRKYHFDMDNVEFAKVQKMIYTEVGLNKNRHAIKKSTGRRKLVLLSSGDNQATVMATLRQITGLDYAAAKDIVSSAPTTVIMNISEREAILNKRALEFVGAKCEIR
ncbi:ribosomal protein L7/L12 [bacterium]|nr:ribosomal protein L7/L12 [bacterium]